VYVGPIARKACFLSVRLCRLNYTHLFKSHYKITSQPTSSLVTFTVPCGTQPKCSCARHLAAHTGLNGTRSSWQAGLYNKSQASPSAKVMAITRPRPRSRVPGNATSQLPCLSRHPVQSLQTAAGQASAQTAPSKQTFHQLGSTAHPSLLQVYRLSTTAHLKWF